MWEYVYLLVSAGCLCDGRREDPGARRPGLQRNGHPSRQTGPLHSLRGGATTAVSACHAGCGYRQWGKNQERNVHDTLEQLFFYIQNQWNAPTCQIPFHTFNSTWQHEQLPPQLSIVLWNRCGTASCFQPGPCPDPDLSHFFSKCAEQMRQTWKCRAHLGSYYHSTIPRGNLQNSSPAFFFVLFHTSTASEI